MSLLLKYYFAMLLFVGAIAAPQWLSGAVLFVTSALGGFGFIYVFFIAKCPKCGIQLVEERGVCSRGFPGRYCRFCEHDLTKSEPSISN